MTKLTDTELAALDLIIAAKREGVLPAGFIDNIVNDAGHFVNNVGHAMDVVGHQAQNVAAVTAAAAAVAAVAGLHVRAGRPIEATAPSGLSLDALTAIREASLARRSE